MDTYTFYKYFKRHETINLTILNEKIKKYVQDNKVKNLVKANLSALRAFTMRF